MIYITVSDTNDGQTYGSFPIQYTYNLAPEDVAGALALGYAVFDSYLISENWIYEPPIFGDDWYVTQYSELKTSKMYLNAEVAFTFDELTYENNASWSSDRDPRPVGALGIGADLRSGLALQAYIYTGGSGQDIFYFGSISIGLDAFASGGVAHAGAGNDWLTGGVGPDALYGEAGDDYLIGGAGDTLDGGDDNDTIDGATGATMRGGAGIDYLYLHLESVQTRISLKIADQAGADVVVTPDTIVQGFEHFDMGFGSGDDTLDLRGAELATSYSDRGNPATGPNNFYGGDGFDTLLIDDTARGTMTIGGFEHVEANFSGLTTSVSVGSTGIHSDGFSTINNSYFKSLTVTGGSGDDDLSGGTGIDILQGGSGDDRLAGGAGDTLEGGDDDDNITGAIGATMRGGAGIDHLSLDLSGADDGITFKVTDQKAADVEIVTGTTIQGFEHFNLTFGAVTDTLDLRGAELAEAYSDMGYEAQSRSYFSGGDGVDTLLIDGSVRGTAAIDGFEHLEADFSTMITSVTGGAGGIYFDGFSAANNSYFNSLSITGGSSHDDLSGSTGIDLLSGHSGDDRLTGGAGDTLDGGDDDDNIEGGLGATMRGGAGTDHLTLDLTETDDDMAFKVTDQDAADVEITAGTTVQGFEHFNLTFGAGDDTIDLRGAALADTYSDMGYEVQYPSYFSGGAGTDTLVVDGKSQGIANFDGFERVDADFSSLSTSLTVGAQSISFGGFDSYSARAFKAIAVTGGSGNDRIAGSDGADTLSGGYGSDSIVGGRADSVDGGAGDDNLWANTGTTARGGTGTDNINLDLSDLTAGITFKVADQVAADLRIATGTVIQGFEHFGITFGEGGDTLDLRGATLSDSYRDAGDEMDYLSYFDGGMGNDTLTVDATSRGNLAAWNFERLIANFSTSTTGLEISDTSISAKDISVEFGGTLQAMNATAGSGNDEISGSAGSDTLSGLGGNDVLDGKAGADTLTGGLGNDSYIVDNINDKTIEKVGEGTDLVESYVSFVLMDNLENLTLLGTAAINGTGNTLANTIAGNAGNNILDGGTGKDTLIGGAGNDTYVLGAESDTVSDSAGTDTITSTITRSLASYTTIENLTLLGTAAINGTGNALANIITGNTGNNILDGGTGKDTLIGGAGNDTYVLGAESDTVSDSAGTDTITSTITRSLASYTTIENLTLLGTAAINGTGNALANIITGNTGNNILDGGTGKDTLIGGAGNDTYVLGAESDTVSDSAGTDTITSTITRSLASYTTIENLTLLGSAAINGTGNALANVITGNAGNNILDGGTGKDTLIGGAGNDTYGLGAESDTVSDSAGTDTITSTITRLLASYTTIDNLTLLGTAAINGTGNALANTITGNAGNNVLNGGTGDDRLYGGLGKDVLVGGAGKDTFVFDTKLSSTSIDTIDDFIAKDDTMFLDDDIFAKVGKVGDLTTAAFYAGANAHDASDRIVYDKVTGELWYDADGNGKAAAIQFAVLDKGLTLTASDFDIIA